MRRVSGQEASFTAEPLPVVPDADETKQTGSQGEANELGRVSSGAVIPGVRKKGKEK